MRFAMSHGAALARPDHFDTGLDPVFGRNGRLL